LIIGLAYGTQLGGRQLARDGILGHQFEKKTRVFCTMLLTVPSTGGFLKTIIYSGFKNTHKKYAKQENSSLFINSIL
jgi:hypothetical protein